MTYKYAPPKVSSDTLGTVNNCVAVRALHDALLPLYHIINFAIEQFDGGRSAEVLRTMHDVLMVECPSYKEFGLGNQCHLSSLALLFNKQSGQHVDERCIPSGFDVIVGAGQFSGGELYVSDLKLTIPLQRGDIVFIRGALVHHGTLNWEGLGRISMVFFVHKESIDQMGVPRPSPWWGSRHERAHEQETQGG